MNDTIQITLTVAEVNQTLNALAHQPYNQVAGLLQKIKEQAEQQVSVTQQPS